jgi:hypothetical protein
MEVTMLRQGQSMKRESLCVCLNVDMASASALIRPKMVDIVPLLIPPRKSIFGSDE